MPPMVNSFQLPDLRSFCQPHFELRVNPRCRNATTLSECWIMDNGFMHRNQKPGLRGAKLGLLAATCYPTCDLGQLRFITDFMSLLIFSTKSMQLSSQLWQRLLYFRNPYWHARFQEHLHGFHEAQAQIARDRQHNAVPDLESYIELRRYSSGLEMAFDLIEYAEGLKLPEYVFDDPIMQELRQNAIDIVSWSTDIFSYSVDQGRGDQHNLVSILMEERHLALQGAVNYAGNLVKEYIETFVDNERMLPSWGDARIDEDVRVYVHGLRDWIVGSIHWAFETDRYFGQNTEEVRTFGWVFLAQSGKEKHKN
ncbi:terpenoid synthase [Neolentinus lepideus HHB14362 ss-1]|uniref:Terpene synthase n=1 Tax=Neolentinus lepideus HHB14362 ss-1 TaxID=1314782 RepID=A0A165VUP9_9AGAM|nr:terpenoid synthase [Neolentinus lepideus HHB14362 ss-1]